MIKILTFCFAAICLMSVVAMAQDNINNEIYNEAWTLEKGKEVFEIQYDEEGASKTFKQSKFLSDCIGPVDYGGNKTCVSHSLNLWDKKLNLEYKRAIDFAQDYDTAVKGDRSKSAALLKHQRSWITYRDARCIDESYDYLGGSQERSSWIYCQRYMTANRTVELWNANAYLSKR